MEFLDGLGWVFAAGATGFAIGVYLGRAREQEEVSYLRAQLAGAPQNVRALQDQSRSAHRGGQP